MKSANRIQAVISACLVLIQSVFHIKVYKTIIYIKEVIWYRKLDKMGNNILTLLFILNTGVLKEHLTPGFAQRPTESSNLLRIYLAD